MNFILDTCVIWELARPAPHRRVAEWIRSQEEVRLYLSVITVGEVLKGIERFPTSRKRKRIEGWLNNELHRRFGGRIIPISAEVAERWGLEIAKAERRGTSLPVLDALIAATGLVHGMTVVTRDTEDMRQTSVPILDPWES